MQGKGTGVIYLLRDRFLMYTSLHPSILEFRFVSDLVRDLDIVNRELLEGVLKMFIESNKILPCNLIIVLSDSVCFVKDFATPYKAAAAATIPLTPEQKQNMADAEEAVRKQQEEFIDHVPFEIVATQTVPMQNGERVYATNQELYETVKSSFENHGFSIESIIPGALFGHNFGSQQSLSPATARLMLQAIPGLKKHNMLSQSEHELTAGSQDEKGENQENEKVESEISEPEQHAKGKSKSDKKRLIILGGVFGLLIIALVVVYITTNQSASTSVQAQPISTVETLTSPPSP